MRVVSVARRPVAAAGFIVLVAAFVIAAPAFALNAAGADAALNLSVLDAVILGLVEGLTEYLPVSSTGHLLVTNELLGLNQTEEATALMESYAICIQAGAILAVLVVYQERVRQMIEGILGRSDDGRRLVLAVGTAFVPTAFIGAVIFPLIRDRLFNGTVPF